MDKVVRGYDRVGDIAIIIIPDELQGHASLIGDGILQCSKEIRLVARRAGNYGGEFRTIDLEIIAGHGDFTTVHREYGNAIHVVVDKVYFSPRSGSERHRVTSLVGDGEDVLVMFSGVAPLPLMIARHSKASSIVGIEKNLEAHSCGLKGLEYNRGITKISLIHGDVAVITPSLQMKFDRVAIPFPTNSLSYIPHALSVLRHPGIIHCYCFGSPHEMETVQKEVNQICGDNGWTVEAMSIHRCGHIGPGKYRFSLDIELASK